MRTYILEVASENPIPHDVLIEHLAVALRDFEFAGFTSIALRVTTQTLEHKMEYKVAHPFDNPSNVVFDDDVKLEEYTGPDPSAGEYTLRPEQIDRLGGIEAIRKMEELVRSNPTISGGFAPAGAPGSFEATLPADPYPLTTRVIDALQERMERNNG